MLDAARLIIESAALGASLTPQMAQTLDAYCAQLVETNVHLNLTAITEPREMEIKHLLDSLALCALPQLCGNVADVGTGGGFPGIALAVARPDLTLTLIDATAKKLAFIERTAAALSIPVSILHGRAEELARGKQRDFFDTVVARAVASLPALCEYCLPLVRPGGHLLAMKGPDAPDELEEAMFAIRELGGETQDLVCYKLPEDHVRYVVVVKKISQTAPKYPRTGKNIQKTPLKNTK